MGKMEMVSLVALPINVLPLTVKSPAAVNRPVPVVMAPPLVVWIERVLAPMSQVEVEAPVKFSAPAEVNARVPEVVVDIVKLPEVESMLLVPTPVREIAALEPAFDTERAIAVCDCTIERAVAAVPLVPFTVRPVTLLTVGVIVFWAVVAGAWTRQSVQVLPAELATQEKIPVVVEERIYPLEVGAAVGRVYVVLAVELVDCWTVVVKALAESANVSWPVVVEALPKVTIPL